MKFNENVLVKQFINDHTCRKLQLAEQRDYIYYHIFQILNVFIAVMFLLLLDCLFYLQKSLFYLILILRKLQCNLNDIESFFNEPSENIANVYTYS